MKFKSRATGDVLYIADSQAKTIRHMVMSGRYEVLHNDEWNESDHPRGEDGRFGSGGSSSAFKKGKYEKTGMTPNEHKEAANYYKNAAENTSSGPDKKEFQSLYEHHHEASKRVFSTPKSKQDPLERAVGAAVRGYFPTVSESRQAEMVQAAMYEATDRPEDIEKRIHKAKNATSGDFESTLKHLEAERHK